MSSLYLIGKPKSMVCLALCPHIANWLQRWGLLSFSILFLSLTSFSFASIVMSIQFSVDALPSQANEDRHRILKVLAKSDRPKASYSFIGLYDGYDGKDCVEHVKDKLHKAISSNSNFHSNNIRKAIEEVWRTYFN